jgi:hypothetical protein
LKFFDVRGNHEWLRWILSFFIAVAIGFIAWTARAITNKVLEFKFEIVQGQMEKGEV